MLASTSLQNRSGAASTTDVLAARGHPEFPLPRRIEGDESESVGHMALPSRPGRAGRVRWSATRTEKFEEISVQTGDGRSRRGAGSRAWFCQDRSHHDSAGCTESSAAIINPGGDSGGRAVREAASERDGTVRREVMTVTLRPTIRGDGMLAPGPGTD